jgi:non-specific serine/threonine protein kinase
MTILSPEQSFEEIESWELSSLLASLVDKCLVVYDQRPDGSERYRLLETVRRYASDGLENAEGAACFSRRHALYYISLARAAHRERFFREESLLNELETEHDNLRSALDRLTETDPSGSLRLAGALGWFWHLRSHFSEGRSRLNRALSVELDSSPDSARALAAAGELAAWAGDLSAAQPLIERAIAIFKDLGALDEVAFALQELGWGYFFGGDDLAARRCMEEALAILTPVGELLLINRARIGLLQMLVSLSELESVGPMAEEALEVARQTGDPRSEHFAVHFQADCALMREQYADAHALYRQALQLADRLGDRSETAVEIQGVAMADTGLGKLPLALTLFGAAAAELEELKVDLSAIRFWSDLINRYLTDARSGLSPEDAAAAWTSGRGIGLSKAVELALNR